jgi:hypothetical protein
MCFTMTLLLVLAVLIYMCFTMTLLLVLAVLILFGDSALHIEPEQLQP